MQTDAIYIYLHTLQVKLGTSENEESCADGDYTHMFWHGGWVSTEEERMSTTLGLGNKSCGSWTQARRLNRTTADMFESWVAGFLSGSNSIISNSNHIDILKQPSAQGDAQGLWAWVDSYCQAHPLNAVAQAADALGGELIRRAASSPTTTPQK